MSLLTREVTEMNAGFNKEIEASAIGLFLDNLQKYQYQYPQASTVRELACNGLDSLKEKNIALSILKGLSKVEDHYVNLEGELFKDSKFDPTYYDTDWLSEDNKVTVVLEEGRDTGYKLTISDTGVGLSPKRLQGYMKLGWSSKRTTKQLIGKFGIGAKAALSTNIPYFTVHNYYNGWHTAFNVYLVKVESIIPKFNLETGELNRQCEFEQMQDTTADRVYYAEKTTRKNGVTVELAIKAHHVTKYQQTIRQQLMYFPEVVFIHKVEGVEVPIDISASVLYEDESLILADQSFFARPHILISGINYGYIDFDELDMSGYKGAIAIKVSQEEVEVTPSRESIIWDDKTKATVATRFKQVLTTAENMVTSALIDRDLFTWWNAARNIFASFGKDAADNVLARLSQIVDLSTINPKYTFDDGSVLFFPGNCKYSPYTIKKVSAAKVKTKRYSYNDDEPEELDPDKAPRIMLYDWHVDLSDEHVYFTNGNLKTSVNRYLLEKHPDGFFVIQPTVRETQLEDSAVLEYNYSTEELHDSFIGYLKALMGSRRMDAELPADEQIRFMKEYRHTLYIAWCALTKPMTDYALIVPTEVVADEAADEVVETLEVKETYASARERRKKMGKIILHTPASVRGSNRTSDDLVRFYSLYPIECDLSVKAEWDEEVYYGNRDDEDKLMMAAWITRPKNAFMYTTDVNANKAAGVAEMLAPYSCTKSTRSINIYADRLGNFFGTTPLKTRLISVAQDINKHFTDFKHINQFFMDYNNGALAVAPALAKWNTARQAEEILPALGWMAAIEPVAPKLFAIYEEVKQYHNEHYRTPPTTSTNMVGFTTEMYASMLDFLKKLQMLQLFIRQEPEATEDIAQLATEIVGPKVTVTSAIAVDVTMYDKIELLRSYIPNSLLLQHVDKLYKPPVTMALLQEVEEYARVKGLHLY